MSPRKKPAVPRVARSVYLPEPLNTRLADEAERRGLSANDLIILALEQMLGGAAAPPTPSPPSDYADF